MVTPSTPETPASALADELAAEAPADARVTALVVTALVTAMVSLASGSVADVGGDAHAATSHSQPIRFTRSM
jgi:hypothetical protein